MISVRPKYVPFKTEMHCLGAGAGGQATSSGLGSRGGVVNVTRAIGVLVCEGRIQGPPRGYQEGPHCTAPLQTTPNNHVCETEKYLCKRYQILVKEIEDRISVGSFLCVEVLLCSDCPCGLMKTTCKDPLFSVSSKSPWQSSSEMLLEYWCIGNIPTKSPETMNSQGLYQAVRSRLHFSQVAAWWSRSNGSKPVYVATRVVPYNEDHLRKFRETPTEHTFPLASSGDGNSIKVTVWALPRMEDVPLLFCPLHPIKEADADVARALTPTKIIPIPSVSHAPDVLVLPALLDDRLQTPCDKSGKHDCRCEEEDGGPPSPSIRPNGERKRRRSLPCGPSEATVSCVAVHPPPLTSVQETTTRESKDHHSKFNYVSTSLNLEIPQGEEVEEGGSKNNCSSNFDDLKHNFQTFSIEEQNGNIKKKYRCTTNNPDQPKVTSFGRQLGGFRKNESAQDKHFLRKDESPPPHVLSGSLFLDEFGEPWGSHSAKNKDILENVHGQKKNFNSNPAKKTVQPISKEANLFINPFQERGLFHESNPGPSTHLYSANLYQVPYPANSLSCTVHKTCNKNKSMNHPSCIRNPEHSKTAAGEDLSRLMSKLSFPAEKNKCKEDGILEWISKVPGRVLSVVPNSLSLEDKSKVTKTQNACGNDVKVKNCNLELSQREFDEVLAVLRAQTPSGRRRTPVKNLKKRERVEKLDRQSSKFNLGSSDTGVVQEPDNTHANVKCGCTSYKNDSQQSRLNPSEPYTFPSRYTQEKMIEHGGKHVCLKLRNSDDPSKPDNVNSVSNKADVLLGAILRTSKDRKGLMDISNGARPRTLRSEETENNKKERETLEEDKSLPSALNKRLIQIKQLFKKDERADLVTLEDHFKEGHSNSEPRLLKEKISSKKRIDFSSEDGDSQEFFDFTGTSLASIHSNSQFYSTNRDEEEDKNNVITHCKLEEWQQSTKVKGLTLKLKSNEKEFACEQIHQKIKNHVLSPEQKVDVMSSKSRNNQIQIAEEDETLDKTVPSALDQEIFRRSLENAASMVFHSRTGLPLTSSPAPLRKGSCCFDFDSSLNSVSSKRSALFELNTPPSPGAVSLEETDRETENVCDGEEVVRRRSTSHNRPQSHALLGSFEESALNGRLEPVSTVQGFTAELGASGSFCPKHRKLPVTVFFYTLGDNDKVSTPYLAHINLGKKGYQVPRSGTVQVTLLNPLGTVVKMFVVLYDLSDMPPRSHTFLRQRTLRDKTLRYLIHLRFMSGKSGRIYLHTDIRMIICRRAEIDTGSEPPQEVRSYNHGPTHPKFSPRC